MTFETIEYREYSGYVEITLNRPNSLNAFTPDMHEELREAMTSIEQNPEIRAVLFTGAGRGFCTGEDLGTYSNISSVPELGETVDKNYNALIRRIRVPIPVIMAINGVAAGAGANLAFSGDLLLAAKSAKFIQAFCKIGLIPDSGGTYFLPRLIGEAKAKALAITGESIDTETAERWGLIWKVVEDENLLAEARKHTEHLATQPTKALGAVKQMLQVSMNNSLDTQLDLERDMQNELGHSEDFLEGVSAFFEKRTPVFKGR
jgi:2-(1,2-epoxy-1,2-dihydrophenyl)acetyl-CoA isomerase